MLVAMPKTQRAQVCFGVMLEAEGLDPCTYHVALIQGGSRSGTCFQLMKSLLT